MDKKYQTTKIFYKTLRNLRILAALTDRTQIDIVDELVEKELQRVQSQNLSTTEQEKS